MLTACKQAGICLIVAQIVGGCVPVPPADTDALHECSPFEPMTVTNTISAEWMEPDDSNSHSFTVPAEPAAGILEARLIPGGPVGASLIARIGEQAGMLAEDAPGEAGQTARIAFEVGPGQQVTLGAVSATNAPAEEYPIPYSIVWTYAGREDCYEPNDAMTDAKAVPTDTDIEAYLLFKRDGDAHPAEGHDDWYRFTLDKTAGVTVRLLTVPADTSSSLSVFDADGDPVTSANAGGVFGGIYDLDAGGLAGGDYFLLVRAEDFTAGKEVAQGVDEPTPEHFDNIYRFRIETRDSAQLHECTPYPAMTVTGTTGAEWSEPNDSNEHSFTVPVEPAAGTVEVLLIPPDEVGPELRARMEGDAAGAIQTDGALERGETARLVFEVGPGQTVFLDAKSNRNAPVDEYPLSYQILWTYGSRVDCYEPNDTMEEAKAIPTDTDIEAYFLFKRGGDAHQLGEHSDWYRFQLDAPAEVTVRMLAVPSDTISSITLLDAEGNSLGLAHAQGVAGGTYTLSPRSLAAGGYFIHAQTGSFASNKSVAVGVDATNPEHFDQTYVFRVERQ